MCVQTIWLLIKGHLVCVGADKEELFVSKTEWFTELSVLLFPMGFPPTEYFVINYQQTIYSFLQSATFKYCRGILQRKKKTLYTFFSFVSRIPEAAYSTRPVTCGKVCGRWSEHLEWPTAFWVRTLAVYVAFCYTLNPGTYSKNAKWMPCFLSGIMHEWNF